MKKYAFLICFVAALTAGAGSANAQNLAGAPRKATVKTSAIGQPPPPPVFEACQSKHDGTVECTQKICEEVGSNMEKLCITYTFTRENYEP